MLNGAGAQAAEFIVFMAELGFKLLAAGGECAARLEYLVMGLRGGAAFLLQLLVQRGDFCAEARFEIADGALTFGQQIFLLSEGGAQAIKIAFQLLAGGVDRTGVGLGAFQFSNTAL